MRGVRGKGRDDMVRRAMEKNIRGSYSSLEYRDLANLLLTRLVEGYGYDNKVQVAKKLVNDVLELVEENTPSMDMVRPGQICWLARSIDSRAGPEKDSKKVLVKLTVVGEEDRELLMKGGGVSDLKRLRVVRMLKEAEEQGGVLTIADVSALTGLSLPTVSKYVSSYEKNTDQVLPTRGTVHDVGSKTSHKKRIVRMYLDGYQPLEIARKTRHNVENVDRYVKDFRRVKLLSKNMDKDRISFLLSMSPRLVEEYLDLVQDYYPEHIRTETGEQDEKHPTETPSDR